MKGIIACQETGGRAQAYGAARRVSAQYWRRCPALCRRSGGFDKGRWPVRYLGDRAGFWPAPVCPIWAIARVPLSNPPRPRGPDPL